MSYFFKNTKKLTLVMSALLLAITLAAGSFAYAARGLPVTGVAEGSGIQDEPAFTDEVDEPDVYEGDEDEDIGFTQTAAEKPSFNRPGEMRGVYLVPGSDFIKQYQSTSDAIKAEIDKAVAAAVKLEMNSVIIDTVYNDKVIFNTPGAPALYESFDAMEYLTAKCRDAGLYVYAIFDASLMGGSDTDKLAEGAYEFALAYRPDGVLIDGYEAAPSGSFNDYAEDGGSIGFDNYVRQAAALTVKTVAKAVRRADPSMQAGLLAGAVWANSAENPLGSATKAKHTSFYSGGADTRGLVMNGTVDFVAVTAYGSRTDAEIPFGEVAGWWADIAGQGGIPLYIVHASSKAGSQETGWSSKDELANQMAGAAELAGCYGSIFNNLSKLSSGAVSLALPERKQEESTANSQKEASKTEPQNTPAKNTSVQDAVTELSTGSSSSASKLIKEISPTGVVMAESGMSIFISAIAAEGADVYAVINGETVPLDADDDALADSEANAGFTLYAGEYIAPDSNEEDDIQILGGVTVRASIGGQSQTMEGAHLAVSTSSSDMTPVEIKTDQARTYPANTKDNVPSPICYPLPKGAQDYAVGKEIAYTKASTKETFYYRVLASGLRVETKDLKEISSGPKNNKISDLKVTNGTDDYTYITLKTAKKITYSVTYKNDAFIIEFHNTTSVPDKATLEANNMFSKATWSGGNKLTLTFKKPGCFMGYKGYYDKSGNLVFRFNNPPASIKKAKIAIDPGHGGKDVGALGYDKKYPESVITAAMAKRVAEELESRGAEILLLDSSGVDSNARPKMAEDFGADLLVSMHCNSSINTKAIGTEAYYFYPFSKSLAISSAANVSKQLSTANRGAKPSYYYVTLSPQMASVLVETGFMSNKAEYEKLLQASYQKKIATGIADSLVAAIKAANTGVAVTGATTVVSDDEDDEDEDDTSSGSGSVAMSHSKLTLSTGDKATLEADADVTWKSSNTAVATVTNKGTVTAKKEGTATITATDKDTGDTATCTVTVRTKGTPGVKIKKLYITSGEERLTVGESVQLEIDYDPSDAYDASVTWESSNKSVATVSSSGKVTAVKAGTAEITATSADGGNVKSSSSCDIIVTAAPAAIADTGIALSKAGEEIYIESDYLRIYPGNNARVTIIDGESGSVIRNADFTWKSDNTSVATVSNTGVVIAKKAGDAIVTATYKGNTLICDIEVSTTKVAVKGVRLNKSSTVIVRGKTEQLTATISPYDATDRAVKWTSSDTKVATVSTTGVVTARAAGTAKITATTNTGKFTASCSVEVVRTEVQISEIELDFDTLEMYEGETTEMFYTLWPDNATITDIVWTSSNTKYATVSADGVVTALAKGKTTIRAASARDKKIYAECVVTVYK